MLSLLNAIDPILVSITNVSIYPPNFSWTIALMSKKNACNGMLKLLSL